MSNAIHTVDASAFKWRNSHGTATVQEIGFLPHQLLVRSDRTGEVKHFSLDTLDASFEDHWDGELVKLVDEGRKTFITVWMEEPLF